jgi:hypothetical protein
MKEVSQHICSAAVMIYCTSTCTICKCTIAENSPSAGSYRGEILGAILTQLILGAAVSGRIGPYPIVTEDCNNEGVVKHGNTPRRTLSSTQPHADVIRVLKRYITNQPFSLKFMYVASHTDDIKRWKDCTLKERINIKVDLLAKRAILAGHASNIFFDGIFSSEEFRVYTKNKKVTGPIKTSLIEHWGQNVAKVFLDRKRIVPLSEFDSIWWDGMRMAMDSYPKMFRIFVAKQVSGWCGSNNKRSLWDSNIANICPNCGMTNETSKHMT